MISMTMGCVISFSGFVWAAAVNEVPRDWIVCGIGMERNFVIGNCGNCVGLFWEIIE